MSKHGKYIHYFPLLAFLTNHAPCREGHHVFCDQQLWPERTARLCRCSGGRCFRRAARIFHRRPAGLCRAGKRRPGARCHQKPWLPLPGPAHHHQPCPRRCAQDRPGVRPAAAVGAADRQRAAGRGARRHCLSGRACTGRQSASGVRRAAHGACRCRARHPGAVRPGRERRRGSRGLCRHHDRLSRPHRPGGGGGAEGHPPPLPRRMHGSRCRILRT